MFNGKRFSIYAGYMLVLVSALLFKDTTALSALEAMKRCGQGDAPNRLAGCTAVIDNPKSSENEMVSALDGRCWALNDMRQYQEALADCNSAIKLNPRAVSNLKRNTRRDSGCFHETSIQTY